ncbi:MAG: SAP domain-containing protein, partial [Nitrospirota bacterium]
GGAEMSLKEVREIAKAKGIRTGNMKKDNIIRTIQRAEGNFDCFGSAAAGECDQVNCLWRGDCLK